MKKNNQEQASFRTILEKERSAFVFMQDQFLSNIQNLRKAFEGFYPKVEIGYSYKTNYVPDVCKVAHEQGCWAEVVSEMEVAMAEQVNPIAEKIIYNGPIKSESSIQKVIKCKGIINIDNENDIRLIEKCCAESGAKEQVKVALRLNYSYDHSDSRFGMDEETVFRLLEQLKKMNHIQVVGYHLHLPFRSIDSFIFRIECILAFLEKIDISELKYLNIGGGFFGNLSEELRTSLGIENPPLYSDYGREIGIRLSKFMKDKQVVNWPALFLEPGSSVVADAFVFVSKIHIKKELNNKEYLVSFAGRHLLSPTNKTISLPISLINLEKDTIDVEKNSIGYSVVGYTCIESDILGKVQGKVSSVEKFGLLFHNVGSYSVVMGSNFILPEPAIYKIKDGKHELVRASISANEMYNRYELLRKQ